MLKTHKQKRENIRRINLKQYISQSNVCYFFPMHELEIMHVMCMHAAMVVCMKLYAKSRYTSCVRGNKA